MGFWGSAKERYLGLGAWDSCIAIWGLDNRKGGCENRTERKRRLTGHFADLELNGQKKRIEKHFLNFVYRISVWPYSSQRAFTFTCFQK